MPDIVITPNRGTTSNPKIDFTGVTTGTIKLEVLADGTISWNGANGSLFSIADSLSGSLMSVNDISGLPAFEVFSDNRVVVGQFGANLLLGKTTNSSNGRLQLTTHTTNAGGIGFGTDTSIYRSATNVLTIEASSGTVCAGGFLSNLFTNSSGATMTIGPSTANSLVLRTNSTAALTFDSSQIGTFAARITVNGATIASAGSIQVTSADAALRLKSTTSPVTDKNTWDIRSVGTGATPYLQFRTVNDANTVFTDRVAFTNDGNVGIGTTSPNAKLHVNGNTTVTGSISATSNSSFNGVTVGIGSMGSGTQNIGIGSSATLSGGTNGSNNIAIGIGAMGICSSGTDNIGIGLLALYGGTTGGSSLTGLYNVAVGQLAGWNISSGSGNVLIGYNTGQSLTTGEYNTFLGHNSSLTSTTTGSYNTIIGAEISIGNVSNTIAIGDGQGNIRIFGDSNGNIGLGITTPSAKLHIAGPHADENADRAATTALIVDTVAAGNGTGATYIKTGFVAYPDFCGTFTIGIGYFDFATSYSAVRDVMTMLGTGYVGIGTSTPYDKLEVAGGIAATGAPTGNTGQNHATIISAYGGISYLQAVQWSTGLKPLLVEAETISLRTGDLFTGIYDRLYIDNNGNVGIGTTAPSTLLHVAGNATFSGYITSPSNGAGAGSKLLIQGSSGTGQAGAAGGNGHIEILGAGATSLWTSFSAGAQVRRRGGILIQTGTAAGDASATYVQGSNFQVTASSATNNGTSTGTGGALIFNSGGTTLPSGVINGGAGLTLGGATSSSASSVNLFGGTASGSAGTVLAAGNVSILAGGVNDPTSSITGAAVNITGGINDGTGKAGNVNITGGTYTGTSAVPSAGDVVIAGGLNQNTIAGLGGNVIIKSGSASSSSANAGKILLQNSAGITNFTIDNNSKAHFFTGGVFGSVGIGVSDPIAQLHIAGLSGITSFTGNSGLGVRISGSASTNDYSGIDFATLTGAPRARIASYFSSSGSYLIFGTSNNYTNGITNSAMTIDYSGNVGIGTTSPAYKLDVSGSIADSIGDIRILPQNSKSIAYTTILSDSGKHIFHPAADTTARTFTIDSNANVPYPIGTALTFVNQNGAGVVTISITSDVMRLAGAGTTGSRTLAANGMATAIKITSTEWIISGTGLT